VADRVEAVELWIRLDGMHRRLDDTQARPAFTRIPRFAYSIASDLVAPFRATLLSTTQAPDGTPVIAVVNQARRDLHDMAAHSASPSRPMASCVVCERKPATIDAPGWPHSQPRCIGVNGLAMKMPALFTSVSNGARTDPCPAEIARSAVFRSGNVACLPR